MILFKSFEKSLIYTVLIILGILLITCSLQTSFAANITINSPNDFKSNITDVAPNSTIELNSSVNFTLDSNNVNVTINKTLTIQSSNSSQNAVINLNSLGRAFNITNDGNLILINITIINGKTNVGGAIYNSGTVTFMGCNFTDNIITSNDGYGGAIYNSGTISLYNCIFTKNKATGIRGGWWCNL